MVRPRRKAQGHRVARAARRPRIRQRRSGVADPPPALSPADRRAAARIHAHGAVSRRVPPHRRARCSSTMCTSNRSPAAWATWPAWLGEVKARIEYLRALRFELRMLPACDQVQVCTPANRDYLLSFLPELAAQAAARAARRHRRRALPVPLRRPRAADHAVSGKLPARTQPRGARLVRRAACCR